MEWIAPIMAALVTIAIIAAVVFSTVRAEIRRETTLRPKRRGHHDVAYGKDAIVTSAALDAAQSYRAPQHDAGADSD